MSTKTIQFLSKKSKAKNHRKGMKYMAEHTSHEKKRFAMFHSSVLKSFDTSVFFEIGKIKR